MTISSGSKHHSGGLKNRARQQIKQHMKATPPNRRRILPSTDPAWERAKAARRNLGYDEAVREVSFLQRQFQLQWSERVPDSPVDLDVILRALTKKRIPFVLTGAHGIAAWTGKPRNTLDVDFLVKAGRNHGR